jgi:hypothetical protein
LDAKFLLIGRADVFIVANLATKGYSEGFVEEEIKKAKSDRYYKGARDVFARETSTLK